MSLIAQTVNHLFLVRAQALEPIKFRGKKMSDSFVNTIMKMGIGEDVVYITLSPKKAKADINELVKSLEPKQFMVSETRYSNPSEGTTKFTVVRSE